ncbi:MAG TPA: hypothetical protein VF461_04845 [Gemmatimonadaceae bacterium]
MRITRSLVSRAALGAMMVVGLVAVTAATKGTTPRTAMFGGPWLSIETPANPYLASGDGALFLVRTYVHQTPAELPVAGRAEGIVDGKRRSVPFTLAKTTQPGAYVVRPEWGGKGIWTVLVTAMPEATNSWKMQAVVDVGADGAIEKVTLPRAANRAPRALTDAEVEDWLRARVKATVAVGAH